MTVSPALTLEALPRFESQAPALRREPCHLVTRKAVALLLAVPVHHRPPIDHRVVDGPWGEKLRVIRVAAKTVLELGHRVPSRKVPAREAQHLRDDPPWSIECLACALCGAGRGACSSTAR